MAQYRFCIFCVTQRSRRERTGKKIQFLAFSIQTAHRWLPSLWSPRHAGKQENQCFPPGLAKYGPSVESDHCLVLKIRFYWNMALSVHLGTIQGHGHPAWAASSCHERPRILQSGPSLKTHDGFWSWAVWGRPEGQSRLETRGCPVLLKEGADGRGGGKPDGEGGGGPGESWRADSEGGVCGRPGRQDSAWVATELATLVPRSSKN